MIFLFRIDYLVYYFSNTIHFKNWFFCKIAKFILFHIFYTFCIFYIFYTFYSQNISLSLPFVLLSKLLLVIFYRIFFFINKVQLLVLWILYCDLSYLSSWFPLKFHEMKYWGFHEKGTLSYLCELGIER